MLPDGRAGEVQKLMADTGLSDPAVVLGNGCVTLMVDSSRYDKVVSVELQFAMDERKNLQIRLSGVKIGLLSMPENFVTDNLLKLRQKLLQRRSEQDKDNPGAGSSTVARIAERGANLFDVMLATIEGKPFVPAGKWKGRLIRLEGIEITPQRLTLQILPTPRPRSKSSQRSDRLAAPSDVRGASLDAEQQPVVHAYLHAGRRRPNHARQLVKTGQAPPGQADDPAVGVLLYRFIFAVIPHSHLAAVVAEGTLIGKIERAMILNPPAWHILTDFQRRRVGFELPGRQRRPVLEHQVVMRRCPRRPVTAMQMQDEFQAHARILPIRQAFLPAKI